MGKISLKNSTAMSPFGGHQRLIRSVCTNSHFAIEGKNAIACCLFKQSQSSWVVINPKDAAMAPLQNSVEGNLFRTWGGHPLH